MQKLQKGTVLILPNGLKNIETDSSQNNSGIQRNLFKNKMHMRKPKLRKGNDEDSVWSNSFTLAIPNIGKIQGQSASLISEIEVVGHKNSRMTP
jgi:hypothetical protein